MIPSELFRALTDAGLDWPGLCLGASEIVLFGSRAAGCATPWSDWDLFILGNGFGRRRVAGSVDIVPCVSVTDAWLGTDLATHVSAFGMWLHGTPNWCERVRYDEAARAKESVVRLGIRGLTSYWDRLAPARRSRHLRRLRLDAQRGIRLRRTEPIPPTHWLDEAWHSAEDERAGVYELLHALNAAPDLLSGLERLPPTPRGVGHGS
jgi:hypothetical protein